MEFSAAAGAGPVALGQRTRGCFGPRHRKGAGGEGSRSALSSGIQEEASYLIGVADLAEHTDFEFRVAQNSGNAEQLRETAEDLKKLLLKSTQ
jgi:hypothetical protein